MQGQSTNIVIAFNFAVQYTRISSIARKKHYIHYANYSKFHSCGFTCRSVNSCPESQVAQTAGTAIYSSRFLREADYKDGVCGVRRCFLYLCGVQCFLVALEYFEPYERGAEALQEARSESHVSVFM